MKVTGQPMLFVNAWRFLNIIFLVHLWLVGGSGTGAFTLILLLLIMATLRWRFVLPVWSVLIDFVICFIYLPYADISYYGLVLPVFELALRGKWLLSLLFLIVPFIVPVSSSLLFWYFLLGIFFGMFSFTTMKHSESAEREADRERKARYEMEQIRTELLAANQSVAHQAELMERYRISRELHDHLGHDLTGTLLAFKAYEVAEDPEDSRQLQEEIRKRLERSTKNLRETVHNMTPTTLIGVAQIDRIVEDFQHSSVDYYKSGDMTCVPAYIWGLLASYLKEALTNVSRHSNATEVGVDLLVTDAIVRLSVQDNGTVEGSSPAGSGLRSLQMRAKSMGGSLSINSEDGYLLVCVIPLEKEEAADETVDRR